MGFFKRLFSKKEHASSEHITVRRGNSQKHGMVGNHHYTELVETIKALKRQGDSEQTIVLLLQCVEATEREAAAMGENWVVAPWYYLQLAIEYRKQKEYAREIAIIERYLAQPNNDSRKVETMTERLEKAKVLAEK